VPCRQEGAREADSFSQLSPWSRVLLEKLISSSARKEIPHNLRNPQFLYLIHSSLAIVPGHSSPELVPVHNRLELIPGHSSLTLVLSNCILVLTPGHYILALVPGHWSKQPGTTP
jgi:hypothetical protein